MKSTLLVATVSLILAICCSGTATEPEGREVVWRRAQTYYEAGQWDEAAALYDQILLETLNKSQRALALTNRGLVAVGAGKWEEAIGFLTKVELGDDPSPLVEARLKAALAFSLIRHAAAIVSETKDDDAPFKEKMRQATGLLNLSIPVVDEAAEAEKRLAEVEERPLDLAPIEAMRREVKEIALVIRDRQQEVQLKKMERKERVAMLFVGISSSVDELTLLGQQELSPSLRQQYLKEYLREQQHYMPHWAALRALFIKDGKEDDLEELLFFQGEKFYLSGLDYLKEGQLWKARLALSGVQHWVALMHRLEASQDPLEALLQDRAALQERRINSSQNELLGSALKEEYLQLLTIIDPLVQAVSLPKNLPAEAEVSAVDIQKQLDWIKERLKQEQQFSSDSLQQAIFDILFYKNMQVSEGELMQKMLEELYISARATPVSLADKGESFLWHLQVVNNKLLLKVRGSNPYWQDKAKVVQPLLQQALTLLSSPSHEANKVDQLAVLLSQALEQWDIGRLLIARLNSIARTYSSWIVQEVADRDVLANVDDELNKLRDSIVQWKPQIAAAVRDEVSADVDSAVASSGYSLTYWDQNKKGTARLFAEGTLYRLLQATTLLQSQPSKEPAALLNEMIARQLQAASWNERLQTLMPLEGISDAVINLVTVAQKETVETSRPFVEQVKAFVREKEGKEWEQLEKELPWKEVIPLYHLGFRAASQAEEKMAAVPPLFAEGLTLQRDAIKYWEEALRKLTPPNNEDEEQKEDPSSQKNERSQEEVAPQELLDLLQQMEEEDQPEDAHHSIPPREGLRPW